MRKIKITMQLDDPNSTPNVREVWSSGWAEIKDDANQGEVVAMLAKWVQANDLVGDNPL